MATRTFDVIDVTEILVHWHAGTSLSEMSQSLGVDRKTIRQDVTTAKSDATPSGREAR
jgi:predicted DNA-binding transcriptional regulator YafY